jgi:hypothetical protein
VVGEADEPQMYNPRASYSLAMNGDELTSAGPELLADPRCRPLAFSPLSTAGVIRSVETGSRGWVCIAKEHGSKRIYHIAVDQEFL